MQLWSSWIFCWLAKKRQLCKKFSISTSSWIFYSKKGKAFCQLNLLGDEDDPRETRIALSSKILAIFSPGHSYRISLLSHIKHIADELSGTVATRSLSNQGRSQPTLTVPNWSWRRARTRYSQCPRSYLAVRSAGPICHWLRLLGPTPQSQLRMLLLHYEERAHNSLFVASE